MNIPGILAELKAERRRLQRAIAALEKLVYTAQKEKKLSYPGAAPRKKQAGTPAHQEQRSKEQRGKLLLFRKARKSVRSKSSQAEEA